MWGFFRHPKHSKGDSMLKIILIAAATLATAAFVVFWWKPFGIFAVKR